MISLITGASGQLGYDIVKLLDKYGIDEFYAPTSHDFDITNKEQVINYILEHKPDVIFHCAAYTAVDKAEDEKERAYEVNTLGTKNIVDAAQMVDAKIVYISTDYVFDGNKDGFYEIDDKTCPKNVYGETKLGGEEIVRSYYKHFIIRISWVFGINGNNFVKTMLKLSETKKELNIVKDQIGSPTYTKDLVPLLLEIAQTDKYGTYHATNDGVCSWAEFARYIFEINNKDVKVNEVTTEEYLKLTNTKQAYRPRNSRLSKKSLEEAGFPLLRNYEEAVKEFSNELEERKVFVKGGK